MDGALFLLVLKGPSFFLFNLLEELPQIYSSPAYMKSSKCYPVGGATAR